MALQNDIIQAHQGTLGIVMYGITINAEQSTVRVVLRLFFVSALLLISYLGGQVCRLQPVLRLARRRKVPILTTTGWLSSFEAARIMWATRSNPFGPIGILMLLYGAILLATDLATAGLVRGTSVRTRCPLDTANAFWVFPPDNATATIAGTPFTSEPQVAVISKAMTTSRRNGCGSGIFGVLDLDDGNTYCADPEDLVGSWRCVDTGDLARTFDPFTPVVDLGRALLDAGKLFGDTNSTLYTFPAENLYLSPVVTWAEYNKNKSSDYAIGPPDRPTAERDMAGKDFVFTSSDNWVPTNGSFSDTPKVPWTIKTAIQYASDFYEPIRMSTQSCTLESPIASWTQHAMVINQWLNIWQLTYEFYRYDVLGYLDVTHDNSTWVEPEAAKIFEGFLNLMTMTLAFLHSSVYIDNLKAQNGNNLPADILAKTRGCVVTWTKIPWPVIILFFLVNVLLIGALGCFARLHILLRAARREVETGTLPEPVGIMAWLGHAVNAAARDLPVGAQSLRHWHLDIDQAKGAGAWTVLPAEAWTPVSEVLGRKGNVRGRGSSSDDLLEQKSRTEERLTAVAGEPDGLSPSPYGDTWGQPRQ